MDLAAGAVVCLCPFPCLRQAEGSALAASKRWVGFESGKREMKKGILLLGSCPVMDRCLVLVFMQGNCSSNKLSKVLLPANDRPRSD